MAARVPDRLYAINDNTMQALADAVRYRTDIIEEMTAAEMAAELNADFFEALDIDAYAGMATEEWSRPEEWPDLDSLNLQMSGEDYIYMTYDADQGASAIAWYITTSDRAPAVVDIGHIENGEFIVDESLSAAHGANFIKWLDEYSGYIVVRITGSLTQCRSVAATANGVTQAYRQQPVLERIAYVHHLTGFTGSNSAWGMWFLERERIGNGDGSALTSIASIYAECERLRSLDVSELHTPNVTNMSSAFNTCTELGELDLSSWDTGKVTTLANMFQLCRALKRIDVTGWDTSKVTTLASTFVDCRRLREIVGIGDWDISAVTTLASTFSTCYSLQELPIHDWNPEKVTTMASTFSGCRSLRELDLSDWNVNLLTVLSSTFSGCYSLKKVNLSGWSTGNVTTVSSAFLDCRCLQHIDISGIKVTSACTNIYYMFGGCWSLKDLDFPEWDVSGLGNGNNTANSMFANCYSLEKITGISDWDFRLTNSLGSMFNGCQSLREVDVSGWNISTVTSLASIFQNCYSLKELDLSDWNPQNCTSLASMFSGCHSLTEIGDISEWDTAKVTTMASMFTDCLSLKAISDLSSWDVQKVTTTASMFSGCASLKEITIKNWNLAACTTIATMFRYCYALEKVTMTGWLVPKLTATAPGVFLGDCPNLQDVDIFPIPLNHSYTNDRHLTHEALIKILQSLPQVSAARTINLLASNNARLTAEEKAIATAKGWTVAN